MKIATYIAGLIACAATLLSAQAPQQRQGIYRDDVLGFSMTPPQFPLLENVRLVTIATFGAPTVDGFTANLNVQVYQGDFDTFARNNESEMKAAGIEVVSSKQVRVGTHRGLESLYRWTVQGKRLKYIALAVENGKKVLLLTGSSLEDRFSQYEPQFRTALSSFKFDK